MEWPSPNFTPFRIALLYIVFGVGVLLMFDVLIVPHVTTPAQLREVQAIKGVLEVGVTAILIFLLTSRSQGALRRANEELERRGRVLTILQRVLRHNLRNEMTIIKGYTSALYGESDAESRNDLLGRIDDAAESVVDDAGRAQRIKRLVTEEMECYAIDLTGPVGHIVTEAEQTFSDADITVTLPSTAVARGNDGVEEAIAELVENAVIHAEDPEPGIRVSVVNGQSWVTVRVADDGPGIPASEREVLASEEVTQMDHSSGLGLWLAHWVADHADGELLIDVDEGGSVVALRLPATEDYSPYLSPSDADAR